MIRLLPRLLPWCALAALCLFTACSTNAPSTDGANEGEGEAPGEGEGEGEGEQPAEGEGEGEGEGEDDVVATIGVAPAFGVPADGESTVEVTIQLSGTRIVGRAIGVSTATAGPDLPAGTVTSVDGSARVLLKSSVPGTFALEVELDGALIDVDGATVEFRPCSSLNDTFLTQAWPVALSRCIGCHNEFGYAPMMGARFVLPFAGDDDFAARGVAAVRDILDRTADDAVNVSELSDAQKTIAQVGPDEETIPRALANALFGLPPDADAPAEGLEVRHAGGALFAPEEQVEIAHFRSFLARVAADEDTCGAGSEHGLASEDLLSLTTSLSPKETFRRAQHAMAATNPTSAVLADITDEASLGAALDTLLENRRVEDRLLDIWNDWLLTDAKTRDSANYLSASFPRRTFFNPLQSEGARGVNSCNDNNPANCCRVPEDPRNLDDDTANDVDPKPENVACEAKRVELRFAAGRESLELLRRIWRDGAPAEEMLLADYTYVNPALARAYGQVDTNGRIFLDGTTTAFNTNTADDATEFKKTVVITSSNNAMATRVPGGNRWPHQGLLTTPAFLSRYQTTVSNRERTRARMMYELFLGVPVMKLAAFVTPEIPAGQSLENLTWDTQPCIVCHALIDPVAANFNHFTGNGGAIAASKPCRNDGMRTPGFGFIALPGQGENGGVPRVALDDAEDCPTVDGTGEGDADNKGPQRLRWLAERVTEHPRFAYAVVVPLYEGIVGTKLLAPPDALADVDFNAKARAFIAQQQEIASLVSTFRAGGGRFQPVVKAILMSRSFRADTFIADVDDETARVFELLNLGHKGKLHTPEVLARRIEALTGLPWNHVRSVAQADNLEAFGAYSVFWGGHDSEAVTLRSREPVAIRAAVARRLGHELSCVVVPQEFSMVTADDRKVFRLVELTDVPLDDTGAEIADIKAKVRTQVARLHTLFWNEAAADNVEIDAGTELFMNALRTMRTDTAVAASLSPCQATATFTKERLPYPASGSAVVDGVEHRRVSTDSTFVVRAWMAVLSSVLADPRFLME